MKERYRIGRLLDQGSYGKVFTITDTHTTGKRDLVVKLSTEYKLFTKEIRTMNKIWKKKSDTDTLGKTPEVKTFGILALLDSEQFEELGLELLSEQNQYNLMSYVIMPRFGMKLEKLYFKRKNNFSRESIYALGIQLINMLQKVHEAGYIYNDLKLDNLLLDYGVDCDSYLRKTDDNIFMSHSVNLIDFGFATRYIDKVTK